LSLSKPSYIERNLTKVLLTQQYQMLSSSLMLKV